MRNLLNLAALLALPVLLTAARTHETNPMSSAEDFAEGRRLYRIHCGVCHGMDGNTGRGARLARRSYRHGDSDAEMFDLIEGGVPGTDMPGVWLEEDDIWRILLFVRTFAAKAGESCVAGQGDVAAGERLFSGQGSCLACHTVGPAGGRLGPDMSFAGEMFTPDQIRRALLEPAADVADRYRTVRLVTAGGERVEGVVLNENSYRIYIMDRTENLRAFDKGKLQSLETPTESLMPAYGNLLTEAQIEHLVAYLCTLREDRREGGTE